MPASVMTRLVAGGPAWWARWSVTGGNNPTSSVGAERRSSEDGSGTAGATWMVAVVVRVARTVVATALTSSVVSARGKGKDDDDGFPWLVGAWSVGVPASGHGLSSSTSENSTTSDGAPPSW